uniref:Dwarfin sma n=1 Tax=Caenorhabditis japonica TaxID=281687 RepID=A0A8R1E164_CAEJA
MNGLLHMHGPAVKKLLGWKIGEDEEKWCEKAVEALVKKLKKKNNGCGTLEDLECVLANPSANSRCITIPKSLDGRLQVSHKKGLPHVIYCRVWRWPDLNSPHELRSMETCSYPYESSSKTMFICINPYHYQRVARGIVGAIGGYSMPSPQPVESPQNALWQTGSSTASCSSSPSPSVFSEDGELQPTHPRRPFRHPKSWAQITYFELNTRVGEVFKLVNPSITVDGYTDPSNSDTRICLGQLTNVNRNGTIENTRMHIGKGIQLDNMESQIIITNNSDMPVFVQSKNTNVMMSMPLSKVCRIPPHSQLCAFEFNLFFQVTNLNELIQMKCSGCI